MGNWKTLSILDSTPCLIFMPEISALLLINCDSFTVPLVREGMGFFLSLVLNVLSHKKTEHTDNNWGWMFPVHSPGRSLQVLTGQIVIAAFFRGLTHTQRSVHCCLIWSSSFPKLSWGINSLLAIRSYSHEETSLRVFSSAWHRFQLKTSHSINQTSYFLFFLFWPLSTISSVYWEYCSVPMSFHPKSLPTNGRQWKKIMEFMSENIKSMPLNSLQSIFH